MTTLHLIRAFHSLASQTREPEVDGELLQRFVQKTDEDAFADLVARHGAMVMGVCQRALQQEQDAEDVFQATFLLLARKASELCSHPCLRGWLYQTAHRTASKLRVTRARRKRHEQLASCDRSDLESLDLSWREIQEIMDQELNRLPDRYRWPLWLCYWEGYGQKEAAQQLGWSEGQLRGRLHRGKEKLRQRLTQRGLTSMPLLPTPLVNVSTIVPQVLGRHTLESVIAWKLHRSTEGFISPSTLQLLKGEWNVIWTSTMKWTLTGLALVGLMVTVILGQTQGSEKVPPVVQKTARPSPSLATDPVPRRNDDAKGWQDLIKTIDPEKHTIREGIWRIREGKILAYPAPHGSRLRIPLIPTGEYELRAKWEPNRDDASVIFILPHGEQNASVELDDRLQLSGLGDLNGVRPDVNETRKKLDLKPGQTYQVRVHVRWTEKQIHVEAKLDGETFLDWEGKRSEVHHTYYAPPKPWSLGLAVGGQSSVFHSLELKMIKGEAQRWLPKQKSTTPGEN